MPELLLKANTPFSDYVRVFDDITLREVSGLALVSVAMPLRNREELADAIGSAFGIPLPDVGSSCYSENAKRRILRMQQDQLFVLFEFDGDDAVVDVKEKLGNVGYFTDQSDSWGMLMISGVECQRALSRICMLDLDENVFDVGSASRTIMEHVGAIILRNSSDSFILLSPRSSAKSFLHAVESAINNSA